MELRVDGKIIDINAVQSVPLGAGARVARSSIGGGIEIDFADGTSLTAIPGWWGSQSTWYVNLSITNSVRPAVGCRDYRTARPWVRVPLPKRRDMTI
jgi:hypothetical protein